MSAPSLGRRLRWTIIAVLIAVLLPLGLLSFQRTVSEVDELSDGRLAQAARTLDVLIAHAGIDVLRGKDDNMVQVPIKAAADGAVTLYGHTYESEVGFQVFDTTGRVVLATANLANMLPPGPHEAGFRDMRHAGYRWRVFTLARDPKGVVIRAAERYDSRHDITQALWIEHGVPLVIGIPLLALLVGLAVRRGLEPLARLATLLSAREMGGHEPVVLHHAPIELRPVIDALNMQFARMDDALERERSFSADVAHELRTPLASAMINLESAMAESHLSAPDPALVGAHECLVALARRAEQLLALARLESSAGRTRREPVDLGSVVTDVIDEMASAIAQSGAELSLAPLDDDLWVPGDEVALRALLRNLVENALRHVPTGGQVQLVLTRTALDVWIDVIDNGPGIPPERRADVFTRFHREKDSRGEGYGLGLSIVQRAAQLHGASIQLLDSPLGRGLQVRVAIPRQG
ncbi:ATP-binding protein [Dyella sp.]|uniref:ATP-binding protein n=1 Tax=Dyella sp. TaxID=1869338 RepID=UPI002ED2CA2D